MFYGIERFNPYINSGHIDLMVNYNKEDVILTDLQYLDKMSALDFFRKYKQVSFEYLQISNGDICLDLGSGTGVDVRAMSYLVGKNGKVYGIDVNQEAIKLATEEIGVLPIEYQVADGEEIPFDDEFFDKTRADKVFQHLENPEKVLKEMIRVTKSQGLIQLVDTEWDTMVIDTANRETFHRFKQGMLEKYENPNSGSRLYGLMKDHSLEDITVEVFTLILTTYDEIDRVFDLENSLKYALEHSHLTTEEVELLKGDLKNREADKKLFGIISGLVVTGRKSRKQRSRPSGSAEYNSEYYFYYG